MEIKDLIIQVKSELEKLKDLKDEIVIQVYNNLNNYIAELEKMPEEKAEVKNEAKTEETEKKEPMQEIKTEMSCEEKELSADVSIKLKEAALELTQQNVKISSLTNELKMKEELIFAHQNKVTELELSYNEKVSSLEKELSIYKEKEKIELQKKFDNKVNKLIELYANLKITKDYDNITKSFNEEQIDKLTLDLSAIIPKKETNNIVFSKGGKREISISPELELNAINTTKPVKKELSSADRAQMLFDMTEE